MPAEAEQATEQNHDARTNTTSLPGAGFVRRVVAVALSCAFLLVCIWWTGGVRSPLAGLLCLPVFYVALTSGVRGSLLLAGVMSGVLLLLSLGQPIDTIAAAVLQTCVLLLLGLAASWFADRLFRAVRAANQRSHRMEQRAFELEWFTDTAVMMESLHDLESILSLVLLRLRDLIRCDWAAVYLRSGDDSTMQLMQTLGLDPGDTHLRHLTVAEQHTFVRPNFQCWRWSAATGSHALVGPFRTLDPAAQSLLVIPLRSTDEVFGILVLGSRSTNTFTNRDCNQMTRLAAHMVYPIQRVRLRAMATTDPLTGLYNRRAFFRRLQDEAERTRRYSRPLALLMLDIDHFKTVNDTYGHPTGDAVLVQLGELLKHETRVTDFVARIGGEELAILCMETANEEARILAERIRCAVLAHSFTGSDGQELQITVSIGVAALPSDATDSAGVFAQADAALYRAKRSGRNRVCTARTPEVLPALAGVQRRRR